MSVRKKEWISPSGKPMFAWLVDYRDSGGVRRQKSFRLKKLADQFAATASVEVREGVHVADSASASVKQAGAFWLASAAAAGLERSTIDQYRQHVELHINPLIGDKMLSRLTVPIVREFEDELRNTGRSPAMVKKVLVSLGSLLADAQERGLVVRNAVREKGRARQKGKDRRHEKRQKGKLKVGVDIPARDEVKAIVGALEGRWRPLLLVAVFCGLRASELRGLRWMDVDTDKKLIHVRQRADRFNDIGRPKSDAGERAVPAPPIVVNALKEWRLLYPRPIIRYEQDGTPVREQSSAQHLVFGNGVGKVESLGNIINRGLVPVQVKAGVTVATGETNAKGEPIVAAKYTGMHALRHFYASWCINARSDGGLELPPKVVQERLGHSSIVMTMDRYGHLFPRHDLGDELADAERSLLG